MKQSAFSGSWLGQRLNLVRINTINTWQVETAYFGNGWGNVLSTMAYTLTFLLFVSVIFGNVRTMAGYTRDQILFMTVIGQIGFYTQYAWSWNNLDRLASDVNSGALDLVLVRPLPALFYTSIRNISLLPQLRDGIPATLFVVLAVNWHNIAVKPVDLLCGIGVMVAGQFAVNAFGFFLALPAFWTGQASDSLSLGRVMFSTNNLPYNGVPDTLRWAMTFALPVLVQVSLAAAVMLGKVPALQGLIIATLSASILVTIKTLLWKQALRNYTSASS